MARITDEQYTACEALISVVMDYQKVFYEYIAGSSGGVPTVAQVDLDNETVLAVVTAVKTAATAAETALTPSGGGGGFQDLNKSSPTE